MEESFQRSKDLGTDMLLNPAQGKGMDMRQEIQLQCPTCSKKMET